MNTPTPETDKFFATFADGEAMPSHAEYYVRLQDLERERDEARGQRDRLADSLKTIEWSNNSEWQSNCAKCALATLDQQL